MSEVQREKTRGPIAVNVVILPPEDITNLAISLSRRIKGSPLNLGNLDYLPHITLAMGCIENIEATKQGIAEATKTLTAFKVLIDKVKQSKTDGAISLSAVTNNEILKLHREILVNVPFVEVKNPENANYLKDEGQIIEFGVYDYLFKFRNEHTLENYWPHITLGWGKSEIHLNLPIEFIVDEIAICRLGNHNTCRQVLAKFKLQKPDVLYF